MTRIRFRIARNIRPVSSGHVTNALSVVREWLEASSTDAGYGFTLIAQLEDYIIDLRS